ncbi:MAG: efflux RND transporter periplasmic adaptor subunit [Alphaproteobacteria bacterium]|nr:efflux RND transporter periplasmic adaptor subunit [Alphaproteobacteria bacterium]
MRRNLGHPLNLALLLSLIASPLLADTPTFAVEEKSIIDEKAVFATVESANVVPARVRTGGTIAELRVRQGDRVEEGQVLAIVGDQKLGLQIQAQSAQVNAARAQMDVARRELERGEQLIKEGFATKAKLEQLRAAYEVAANTYKSLSAQQSVTQQQQTEGKVLAPTAGRILTVPVTAGSVVMPGDTIATLAEQNYILRLSIPERHAAHIKSGDTVRVDNSELGNADAHSDYGTIKLVYPKVENGRVQADATVKGLGDYFVGGRVRVWIGSGERVAIVIPADYITTRSGIDTAGLKTDGGTSDIPVQRGHARFLPDMPSGIEILSGLKPGDVLEHP